MKIKFSLLFVFSLISFSAFAQIGDDVEIIEFEDDSIAAYEYYDLMVMPEFRIGVSPTAVLNGFPAIQASFDYRINDISEVSLETGYVFSSGLFGKGFRMRGSYEVFLYRGEHFGFFAGTALTSVNVWEFTKVEVLYEDAYIREHAGFRRRNMIGGYATAGFKFHLGRGVMLETSSGLGFSRFYTSSLIDGVEFNRRGTQTILPSELGWVSYPGYYNNLNISFPLDLEPARTKIKEYKAKRKKPSKRKKKKRKKKRRNRR